jgi:hypothetical protein
MRRSGLGTLFHLPGMRWLNPESYSKISKIAGDGCLHRVSITLLHLRAKVLEYLLLPPIAVNLGKGLERAVEPATIGRYGSRTGLDVLS